MSKQPAPKSCPICGKPVAPEHLPFCSDRCRKIDLNRWLGETYRIPQTEDSPPSEDGVEYDE